MKHSFDQPYEFVTMERQSRFCRSGDIVVSEHILPHSHTTPVHWHEFFELELVLEGTALHFINNEENFLSPGCAYLITNCDFHRIVPQSNLRIFNLSFTPDSINAELTTQLSGFHCRLTAETFATASALFQRALNDSDQTKPFSRLLLQSIAQELLICILRDAGKPQDTAIPSLVQKAIATVNSGFHHSLTLAETAARLNVSPNYLGTLFQRQVGMNFNRYVNRTRLKYACSQLLSGEKTVKEIAFDSGYSSVEYFLAVFKRELGCTPTEFRKANSPK